MTRPPPGVDLPDLLMAIGAAEAVLEDWPAFHDHADTMDRARQRQAAYRRYQDGAVARLTGDGFAVRPSPTGTTTIARAGLKVSSTGGAQAALRAWIAKARDLARRTQEGG